jgi:transcriptional regulator with XRE-family HTH domain
VARKKHPAVSTQDRETVGAMLRDLRKAAGYKSAQAAAGNGCSASLQTLYAYERGALVPSLAQFLELVEFYVLAKSKVPRAKLETDLRAQGVAAVARALALPVYHVSDAWDLMARMQPDHRKNA